MRASIGIVFSSAGPQNEGPGQSGPAADAVNDRGTGEVDETEILEPAASVPERSPGPGTADGVDYGGDDDRVNEVGPELGALRHRPRHDGRRRRGEDGLEEQEGVHPVGLFSKGEGVRIREELPPTEDPFSGSEHETEADRPECEGADGEVHQVLHEDVDGVLGAGEAALYQGEASLHEEHEEGGDTGPVPVQVGGCGGDLIGQGGIRGGGCGRYESRQQEGEQGQSA